MGSPSVTCHPTQVNAPRLTPAVQADTRFTYPGGMEGWVDLVELIAPRPGVEPATFRSRVRRRTAAPPRQPNHYDVNLQVWLRRQRGSRCWPQSMSVVSHWPTNFVKSQLSDAVIIEWKQTCKVNQWININGNEFETKLFTFRAK